MPYILPRHYLSVICFASDASSVTPLLMRVCGFLLSLNPVLTLYYSRSAFVLAVLILNLSFGCTTAIQLEQNGILCFECFDNVTGLGRRQ